MIHTFELVTIFGTGDAELLAGGISEALVTTETGLVIAVPVLLVHAYLTRRVRTIVSGLEQAVDDRLEEVGGQFRRVRQDEITNELMDIIIGFEALKKKPSAL